MAFGQPAGPPASASQLQRLAALLQAAGHSDFRDARGPMGFTQRQAAGKFTRDEADAFIEQLEQADDGPEDGGSPSHRTVPATGREARSAPPPIATPGTSSVGALSKTEQALRKVPSPMLAAELQRRGWVVVQP